MQDEQVEQTASESSAAIIDEIAWSAADETGHHHALVEQEERVAQHRPGITGALVRLFAPNQAAETALYQRRLAQLDAAVRRYPDEPGPYVMRGELLLGARLYDLAAADFRQALELASRQIETNRWGIVTQGMRDRAHAGLERILNHLR